HEKRLHCGKLDQGKYGRKDDSQQGSDVGDVVQRKNQQSPELCKVHSDDLHHQITADADDKAHQRFQPDIGLNLTADALKHATQQGFTCLAVTQRRDLLVEAVLLEQQERDVNCHSADTADEARDRKRQIAGYIRQVQSSEHDPYTIDIFLAISLT